MGLNGEAPVVRGDLFNAALKSFEVSEAGRLDQLEQ